MRHQKIPKEARSEQTDRDRKSEDLGEPIDMVYEPQPYKAGNKSQKDIILEEQKRIDTALPKKKKVVDVETEGGFQGRIKGTFSDISSMGLKDFVLAFTQKRAFIVILVIVLVTAGLVMYAAGQKNNQYEGPFFHLSVSPDLRIFI